MEDDPHSGCPNSSASEEIVQQVNNRDLDDRQIQKHEMVEPIDFSKGLSHFLLTEIIDTKKAV